MGKVRQPRRAWIAIAVAGSLIAGCGGDDDDADSGAQDTATADTTAPANTEASEPARPSATTASSGDAASETEPSTAAAEPGNIDPEGVLKLAYFFGPTTHLDPTQAVTNTDVSRSHLVFGTLMREQEDGSVTPWMAEDVEVVDPQTVRITLRPDVTFTDGTPFDAAAVQAGLMRTRSEPASEAVAANQHSAFQTLTAVDVIDPLTVEAHLDQPLAGEFVNAIAGNGGLIVSPKQAAEHPAEIDTKPIGAGPYMLVDNIPEQLLSFRKNPDFWDADTWQLGGIDMIMTPTGAPMVNGLLAGTIDLSQDVALENFGPLEAEEGFETGVITSASFDVLYMCTTKPPLDAEKLRQAIQIGINRDEYNDLVYGGLSEPAYGFYPEGNLYYDPELAEIAEFDQERAKQLVAEAGAEGETVDLYWLPPINYGKQAEVLQAQMKEIGINLNLIASPPDELISKFIGGQAPGAAVMPTYGSSTGVDFYARQYAKGGQVALCGVERPDVMDIVLPAGGMEPDDPAVVDAFKEAQVTIAEHAYTIPVVFQPRGMGWNTERVGGTPTTSGNGGFVQFDSIYIKQQ